MFHFKGLPDAAVPLERCFCPAVEGFPVRLFQVGVGAVPLQGGALEKGLVAGCLRGHPEVGWRQGLLWTGQNAHICNFKVILSFVEVHFWVDEMESADVTGGHDVWAGVPAELSVRDWSRVVRAVEAAVGRGCTRVLRRRAAEDRRVAADTRPGRRRHHGSREAPGHRADSARLAAGGAVDADADRGEAEAHPEG